MNNSFQKPNSDRCPWGKSSIILPLVGVGIFILPICFWVYPRNGGAAQSWLLTQTAIFAGLLLLVLAILGLIMALVSFKKEKNPFFSWIGITLNIALLSLMIFLLVSLFNNLHSMPNPNVLQ
ncbi:MAG TPA: hypothetical protein VGN61_04440 [Verrucomicrobiae bacterium]